MNNATLAFHSVFIIDKMTTTSLVSRHYSKGALKSNNIDDSMVSGMVQALESFVGHLAYSTEYKDQLQEINFGSSRIIYDRLQGIRPLIAVAFTTKNISPELEHEILQNMLVNFHTEYNPVLRNFRGNVNPFLSFDFDLCIEAHIQDLFFKNTNSHLKSMNCTNSEIQTPFSFKN